MIKYIIKYQVIFHFSSPLRIHNNIMKKSHEQRLITYHIATHTHLYFMFKPAVFSSALIVNVVEYCFKLKLLLGYSGFISHAWPEHAIMCAYLINEYNSHVLENSAISLQKHLWIFLPLISLYQSQLVHL